MSQELKLSEAGRLKTYNYTVVVTGLSGNKLHIEVTNNNLYAYERDCITNITRIVDKNFKIKFDNIIIDCSEVNGLINHINEHYTKGE